ncbi:unnamed protein product, partial [Ectocarpus sp. 12 AP-2014]
YPSRCLHQGRGFPGSRPEEALLLLPPQRRRRCGRVRRRGALAGVGRKADGAREGRRTREKAAGAVAAPRPRRRPRKGAEGAVATPCLRWGPRRRECRQVLGTQPGVWTGRERATRYRGGRNVSEQPALVGPVPRTVSSVGELGRGIRRLYVRAAGRHHGQHVRA